MFIVYIKAKQQMACAALKPLYLTFDIAQNWIFAGSSPTLCVLTNSQ